MRNRNAFVCLIIACLMLTAAACSSSATAPTASPKELLKSYMACINTGDYEKMYGMISEKSGVTKDDFIARNKNIYNGIEAKNLTVKMDDNQKGDTISYETTVDTMAGPFSFTNKAVFKQYEGQYKLEWDSGLIFPGLGNQDKVRVSTSKGARGSIFDRNGKQLVGPDKVYSAGFVPGKINPETRDADIAKVGELLNMTVETINKKLSEKWVKDDLFVPLKNIGYNDTEKKDLLLQIKGVKLNTDKDRVYALGEKAAQLTGYISNITQEELDKHPNEGYNSESKIGKVGLESLLEERIRGVDGCRVYITDKDNKEKKTLVERKVRNGENVTLTIDSALQAELYDQMRADKGAAVVMNPKTGEILALISTPSYDPNDFILGMTEEKWAIYNNEETRPMLNRFKATYAPGSSMKPITASIGLGAGAFTAKDDFGHSGLSWQKDQSWGEYTITTTKEYSGAANVQNALIYSDNIYFAKAALKTGADKFAEGLKSVGFGEQVPFEFGLNKSSFGKELAFTDEADVANSGFGQGKVLINPVHMASIYSAFVNNGNMLAPFLEKGKETTVWKENVFSEEVVQTVRNAMIQVVENPGGTAHAFKLDGVKMAGKTGTAEIKDSKDDTEGTELGWFVAYPVDDSAPKPYLAVAMIEDVKGRGGSHYVIPIVRAIYTDEVEPPAKLPDAPEKPEQSDQQPEQSDQQEQQTDQQEPAQ